MAPLRLRLFQLLKRIFLVRRDGSHRSYHSAAPGPAPPPAPSELQYVLIKPEAPRPSTGISKKDGCINCGMQIRPGYGDAVLPCRHSRMHYRCVRMWMLMARPRCGFSCTICGEALDLPRSREAPSLPPVVRVRGFSSGKRRGDDNYGGAVRGLDGVAEEKVGLTMRWDGEVDDEGCDVGVPGYA